MAKREKRQAVMQMQGGKGNIKRAPKKKMVDAKAQGRGR
jgi:hypothetical protein